MLENYGLRLRVAREERMEIKDQGFGEFYEHDDGDLRVWVAQRSSVHIKAVTKTGDPVELGEPELRKLIAVLNKLLEEITQ